ncbi:hypothetical protein Clacol_005990 [Clathrus columnatus]|uniref:Uncharacterized protein n=1 Tax=Clathrus columnatus TaxID=1419009 RepID=A0AAV5ADH4_9AGAM|nr:hypothetical protein Clacol_005990 [Clathrus columnatus]
MTGNKGVEIPIGKLNEGIRIQPMAEYTISSCGRLGSPSGTEGSFELVDQNTKFVYDVTIG